MAPIIRNIKSIQVFSTVCETLNVTRAAQILNTSQSSVSYHIKKLETELGTPLFRRTSSGLHLTETGDTLARHVARGLGAIGSGIEQVARRAGTVRVALLPMFASRWLSSRLGHLLEACPEMQLAIQNHDNSYAHMASPEAFADLGVQWGRGNWPEFEVTRLWPEKLVVVCSPDYLRAHPIRTPADLAKCMLLHVDDTRMWEEWFGANGQRLPASQSQMMLEDRHFQLSSTINGLGVSLFVSWLVRGELARGDLVDPFGRVFDTSFAYHLIVPGDIQLSPVAEKFRVWLTSEKEGLSL
ncbi:MAG: transcriptional regulator [Rhodobacteraceae bacterium CG17_big_fil_post_rev_8_21_14_2_50_63_15]|nr:MAG: transcriptional regulator [Rhodobacteraceae bacterium CG17_big_fil_post_rev_8_21_14_2_50_63_15]